MRAFRKSWIGIGLAILFAASLFFFRGGERYSNLFNSDNFVANISGTPISTSNFLRSMDMYIDQFSQMTGSKLDGDQIRNFQIHQLVLQNLVNMGIFENEFDKVNYILDETTIAKETKKNFPNLYVNNKINDDALNNFLRQQGLKIEDLVDLISFETRSFVFDQIFFNKNYPEQLQLIFNKQANQIREIDFLKIPLNKITLQDYSRDKISRDNSELIDYFKGNSNNYMSKEQRDISYILIKKNDFLENFTTSDKKIEEYYNNNKNLFTNPEERSFKQFNFKTKEEADSFKLIISGKSNDEVVKYAQKNNIVFNDFKNVNRNKVLDQLANAIFKLSKGNISEVIETPLAHHIIILDEIYPERLLEYNEVKNEIKDTLTSFELDSFFNELKTSLDQQIVDGYTIYELANQNNLELLKIKKVINANNSEDKILTDLISFSFSQNKEFVSDVIDIDNNISFIVNIDNIYPAEQEKIDDVFEIVLNDFIFSKKIDQARTFFDNNKDNFENISRLYGINSNIKKISLNNTNELPSTLVQKILSTDINKITFDSDENSIYFAKIRNIEMPTEGEITENLNLQGDLKTAFGSEIIKTKEISFNDELINGLLSQYK